MQRGVRKIEEKGCSFLTWKVLLVNYACFYEVLFGLYSGGEGVFLLANLESFYSK